MVWEPLDAHSNMKVTFQTTRPPLEDTEQFESVYPEGLQVNPENKAKVLSYGYHVWVLVGGVLAGEMYGLRAEDDDEGIPDIAPMDFYIGSFTILPEYQGGGLGKTLFAYSLGKLFESFARISWHSTSLGMDFISEFFGAQIGPVHPNWFGTGKPAVFRYLEK